jgi:hypothetical protein
MAAGGMSTTGDYREEGGARLMRSVVSSIESEYRRYKALGEGSFEQASDEDLSRPGPGGGNSLAVVVWHIAGNLKSRFTEFLTSDGEKPWRNRDSEFLERTVSRRELLEKWEDGWSVLFAALAGLKDDDLPREVAIRGVALTVSQALHRSLAHTAYHVGQIVYLAKGLRGGEWRSLSIPRPPR